MAPHLNNLPPPRDKIETIEILKKSIKASAALAELKGIANTIPNQGMLVNAIILREAKDSSEIENIVTTNDELYKALTVNQTNVLPEIKEIINYRKAIFFGFDLVKKQGFLRLNDIIAIQQKIVDNDAGIRSSLGTVLKNDKTGEIVYTPPQNKLEIMDLLSNFIQHFNENDDEISALIQMAILHFQFESIHPFYDGNGRTGRILNILYLILNNLIDVPILYLSSYIIDYKPDYYRLLNHTFETGEWSDWIIYMLDAIEKTAQDTITRILKIKKLLDESIENVQSNAPKIYRKELVELLFEQPYSKIDFVCDRLNVERKAASRYLST